MIRLFKITIFIISSEKIEEPTKGTDLPTIITHLIDYHDDEDIFLLLKKMVTNQL